MSVNEILRTIRDDQSLTQKTRDELLDELNSRDTDSEKEAYFNKICQKKRHKGPDPEPPISADEVLGRIAFKPVFARRIAEALAAQGHYADVNALDELFSAVFEDDFYESEDLEHFFNEIAGELSMSLANALSAQDMIEKKLAWLFRNPSLCDRSSRTGFPDEELPYRLGLPLASEGSEYLAFEIKGSSTGNARQPTVLDCHWEQLIVFEPGGKTLPTGGFPKDYGLAEVVADAPNFRFLYGIPVGIVAGSDNAGGRK